MGFNQGIDPGTFSLQLIDTLSQQIGQGHQQIKEQSFFDELLPQIQQAQDPQQILNLITQAQGTPGISQEAKQQFTEVATPAFNLAKQQLQNRDNLGEKQAKIDLESDQKLGLAELIRQSGGKITDEQALRVPLISLSKQHEKQLQLGKEEKSKTFRDNSTFMNDVFKEERKSFDQSRLVKQARLASQDFNAAAGQIGRLFPAVKGSPQAKFDTSVGLLIENFTKLFPGRISDVKFRFLQTLLPLASQRQDVRESILDVLQDLSETPALTAEVMRNIQRQDPNALEDPNLQNRLNQELGIKFSEIDSKLDALNQFQGIDQGIDQDPQQQVGDILQDPDLSSIVEALRAQNLTDDQIRSALQQ